MYDAPVTIPAAGDASQPTSADDIIAEERLFYDGNDTFGAAPTKGDITRKEEISGWAGGGPTYVTATRAAYDPYGRQVEATDVGNKKGAIRDLVKQAATDCQRELDTFWARQGK